MTTPTSPDVPDDDYVLARTSEEYQRLRRQAQLWEQVTAQLLDRVGLGAGMRCLDVGCGPGEVMRLMAERVGAGGRVTGLDNDGRVGREAVQVLRATVAGQFEFVQADAETTGEPPGAPFDLVYARLLLFHVRDPVAMVRTMYDWTRPGGVLVVQDWDCRPMDIFPRLATWAEYERVMYGVFDKAGRDPRIGVKMPLHFAAAGLGEPDGTDVAGQLRPLAEIGGLFQGVYQSMLPAGLRWGLTTEAAGQAFIAEISEAIRQRRGVAMSPLLVSAWKNKPRQ
jgi:ubiquinone/menaquinone biosynthesis C-methylase UbiE